MTEPLQQTISGRAWLVTASAVGINLALGILYAWSVFKSPIAASATGGGVFAWSASAVNDPYALACLVFSLAMVPAGKLQDRFGPRITGLAGAVLTGSGLALASASTSYVLWLAGFGVLTGLGIACGYACTTPAVMRCFPASRSGLAVGLVVSGAGLAPVYMAPLAQYLINARGLPGTLLVFAVGIAVTVSLLSLGLISPGGHTTRRATPAPAAGNTGSGLAATLRTAAFRRLWLLFFAASGAGLMVIGSVAGMAGAALGDYAFWAVAVLAAGNATGRLAAGAVSDRIGRRNTLLIGLVCQTALMLVAAPLIGGGRAGALSLVLLAGAIGFNYGTNLSLFPALARDRWGLRDFGVNYGALFTAWGVGGLVMARLSQTLHALSGGYGSSFIAAACLLLAAVVLALGLERDRLPMTAEGHAPSIGLPSRSAPLIRPAD